MEHGFFFCAKTGHDTTGSLQHRIKRRIVFIGTTVSATPSTNLARDNVWINSRKLRVSNPYVIRGRIQKIM